MAASSESVDEALARVVRDDSGSVLAALIARLHDFDLAEDALRDAIAQALVRWRRDGVPRNGGGWLLTAARRRAIDRLRRVRTAGDERIQLELLRQLEGDDETAEEDQPIPDERLRLIFTCCHPALNQEAQVALTLRTLCGLSTHEIARAYVVADTTMAQRLVRAKKKIRAAVIPYEVPERGQLDARLNAVLDVLYLIYNEGFSATEGPALSRADLCAEAIRLGRILYRLMPHPEAGGLLALMLLHDARRAARLTEAGEYVPIDEQDRSRWDRAQIEEGTGLVLYCLGQRRPGPVQIQAAISALHAEAETSADTDWLQIFGLYTALAERAPSPVVTLNRALALARADTPQAGLSLAESVAERLDDYQPFHAAHADLLRRCERHTEARAAYQRAIAMSKNAAEREFLEGRLERLDAGA